MAAPTSETITAATALHHYAGLNSCPILQIARPGKPLRRWRATFLAYFDTEGAGNGGTEAVNGIIEPGRHIARDSRSFDHYRLRMPLIIGDLDASPHSRPSEPP